MHKDYYRVLDIDKSASQADIESKYQYWVERYTEAMIEDVAALNHFEDVQRAYDVLSDPVQRQIYDTIQNEDQIIDGNGTVIEDRNDSFKLKDAVLLTLFYFTGVNFLIPIVVVIALALPIIGQGYLEYEDIIMLLNPAEINFYVFLVGTLTVLFFTRKKLKAEWIKFKEYFKKYEFKIIKNYVSSYLVMILINVILIYVFKIEDSSANQQAVESILFSSPFMVGIVTIIFAPLLEEIVFRGGLFLGIQSKVGTLPATLISSLSFGLIHVLPQLQVSSNPLEILFIIPYASLGFFMVKSVKDTNSLWGGIGFHFINNLVATLAILFI